MKTVYGKLANLIVLLSVAAMLFSPMRFGGEDHLYAHPRSIRMSPGDSYSLSYRLDADEPNQTVAYSSTNERVAAVNSAGLVTAMGSGKAQILLDAENGARARAQIEVIGEHVSTLTLNTSSLNMEKGQVTGLKAVFDDREDNSLVKWSSADERVATVDAIGRVVAVGGGATRVTATAPNGLTADAVVSVHVAGDAMRITPENVTVGSGAYLRLDTSFVPPDATDEVARWASSDENILSVEEDGTLYASAQGQVVLSAFSRDGLGASTVITVEQAVADFEISPAAATIERGKALTLEPRFFDAQGNPDENASGHYVTWTTSNPAVATVQDGVVTAVASGTARISASADGRIASCVVTVQTLVQEVRLNLHEIYVLREETVMPIQLEAEVLPADADDTRLTWTTDNDLVATVNPRGLVELVGGYGTATITATAATNAKDSFVVNVVAELPEGVKAASD